MKWEKRKNAVALLFDYGFRDEGIVLYWQVVRQKIFEFLQAEKVEFDSTSDALCNFIQLLDENKQEYREMTIFLDSIATIVEWDESKCLTEQQSFEILNIFLKFEEMLAPMEKNSLPKLDSQAYYEIITQEIERHLEDTEVSKLAHWHAARVFENRNKYLLGLPATLSAVFLSWIVSQEITSLNLGFFSFDLKLALSLLVSILSGLVTFLNFNEVASKHRASAQKYHQLWRNCKNWRTDFPDDSANSKAKEVVQKYRELLNEINNEAPQIPKWAWKSTQKQKEEGSTRYDRLIESKVK